MQLAIDTLNKLLIQKEAWLDDSDDYDEASMSMITENIKGLKKAIDILEIHYRRELVFSPEKKKNLQIIKKFVCKKRKIRQASLNNKNRDRYVAESRHLMFRVYYELFIHEYNSSNDCFVDTGNFFNRDRNCVRHGINVTRDVEKLDNISFIYLEELKAKYNFK